MITPLFLGSCDIHGEPALEAGKLVVCREGAPLIPRNKALDVAGTRTDAAVGGCGYARTVEDDAGARRPTAR